MVLGVGLAQVIDDFALGVAVHVRHEVVDVFLLHINPLEFVGGTDDLFAGFARGAQRDCDHRLHSGFLGVRVLGRAIITAHQGLILPAICYTCALLQAARVRMIGP